MSKEKGILFKGEMVRAILEGRKTQTRRTVKSDASSIHWNPIVVNGKHGWADEHGNHIRCNWKVGDILYVRETWAICDYAEGPDDIDCESEEESDDFHNNVDIAYQADSIEGPWTTTTVRILDSKIRNFMDRWEEASYSEGDSLWFPSIHMPKSIARIWLKVTNVRVERLLDISEADAIAEGIDTRLHPDDGETETWRDYGCTTRDKFVYGELWGPRESYFSLWDKINGAGSHKENPWCWVVEFERVEKPN